MKKKMFDRYWVEIISIIIAFIAGWLWRKFIDWLIGPDYLMDDPVIVVIEKGEK